MELFPRNLLEVAPSSEFFNKKELGVSRVYDSSGTYVPCKNPTCECKCVCSAHDSFNYAVSKYRKRSHHGLDSKKSLEVAPSSEFFNEQELRANCVYQRSVAGVLHAKMQNTDAGASTVFAVASKLQLPK